MAETDKGIYYPTFAEIGNENYDGPYRMKMMAESIDPLLPTTAEKTKLEGIESGAQVNVIGTVKVNGTALIPSNKEVDVPVPTKTSDLNNDSGFGTYTKPSGGIPKTDLSSAVQTSLGKADTAVQDVSGKEDKSNKVTSISSSSTNTQYPSAKLLYDQLAEKQSQILSQFYKNLFRTADWTIGKYVNFSNGHETVNNDYQHTDFIPVKEGEIYCVNGKSTQIAFYNQNKQYVSGTLVNRNYNNVNYTSAFKIPNNCVFMIASVERSLVQTLALKKMQYNLGAYVDNKLDDVIFTANCCMISQNGGILNQNGYYMSQPIPVLSNEIFETNILNAHCCFLDKDLNFISGVLLNMTYHNVVYGNKFITPNNSKYVVLTYNLVEGTAYLKELDNLFNQNKILCLGDSITHGVDGDPEKSIDYNWNQANYTYNNYILDIIGCYSTDAGYPGANASSYYKMMRGQSIGVSYTPFPFTLTNYNIFTIMLGTNQGLTDTVDEDTNAENYENYSDTNTGNYCKIIEYIYSQVPSAQIILLTPPYANDRTGRVEQLELTRNVIIKIASKYNLPYIDVYKESGISQTTLATYAPYDNLHLSRNIGYKKLGTFLGNKIKNVLSWVIDV